MWKERGTQRVIFWKIFGVVVIVFTPIIKSVVTAQSPVTPECRNTPQVVKAQTKPKVVHA